MKSPARVTPFPLIRRHHQSNSWKIISNTNYSNTFYNKIVGDKFKTNARELSIKHF
jgi:hypothetical protein